MGLYLGSGNQSLKIILNGVVYKLNLYSSTPMTNGVVLLSSDNYILKGSDNQYLTVVEEELLTTGEIDNDTNL